MKSALLTSALVTLLVAMFTISSCKKKDKEPPGPPARNCDHARGTSKSISEDPEVFSDAFRKTYEAGTNNIAQLLMQYRSVTSAQVDTVTYQVTHASNAIILDGGTASEASFNYNSAALLETASFRLYDESYEFRFSYNGTTLTEITYTSDSWAVTSPESFVRITYDADKQNVQRLVFLGTLATPVTIDYEYDYTRTPSGQFYAEEQHLGRTAFWKLLKAMNLVPSLRPVNLVTRSFLQYADYPGNVDCRYSDQQMNAEGQVNSYHANIQEFGSTNTRVETWTIDWSCYDAPPM